MVQILHHLQMHGLLDPWNVCILNLEKWILRFPVHLVPFIHEQQQSE